MAAATSLTVTAAVVNSAVSDYDDLLQMKVEDAWNVFFLASGREALRRNEVCTTDLWIINVELADMSGFDLVEMLETRTDKANVFTVADGYRIEDEIKALSLGISQYLCKPLHGDYLRQWHPRE